MNDGADHRRSALGLSLLVQAGTHAGISAEDMLTGTGHCMEDLADRDRMIALEAQYQAVRNATAQGQDPLALGASVGLSMSLTQLGIFGFAAMASPTIRELLTMSARYFTLTSLVLTIEIREDAHTSCLILDADHIPADVRPYFVGRDLAGIGAVVQTFLGPTLTRYQADIRVGLPVLDTTLSAVVAQMPVGHLDQDDTFAVRFPTEMLDEPLPQADPHTVQTCLAQCEQLLQRQSARTGLTAEVRTLLLSDTRLPPTSDEVATALAMHPRTLRRRLADEGTSYRDLLNELRRGLAGELLTEVGLTVEQVSERLGYSETAAFNHAFRRWYGMSPSQHRDRAD